MTAERTLSAILAHGLLNTASIISASARALRQTGDRLPAVDREDLTATLAAHAALLDDGLRGLLEHCSDAFGDAATVVALTARTITAVPAGELSMVLQGLIDGAEVVKAGLGSLVRGLPQDLVTALDSLQR